MISWKRWRGEGPDAHPNDEQLVALIDGQLGARQQTSRQHHVESCWRCLARRQQMERTIFALVERRKQVTERFLPLSSGGEERLLLHIDRQSKPIARGWTVQLLGAFRHLTLEAMNPIVATALVVIFAVSLLFMIWQRHPSTLNGQDLLNRAQARELAAAEPGLADVICQRVVISSRSQALERTLYHDVRHRRPARLEHLDARAQHVKHTLESAGLNWDSPLSAVDYSRWRTAQSQAQDFVEQGKEGLITVITTLAAGTIAKESLTLRTSDLHPVRRTVDVRDDDHFEIAELSYTPLSWSQLNTSFSEIPHGALRPAPRTLTGGQLDEAELGARLALNHVHADASEQIEIVRSETAVKVTGVVETTQRKLQLDRVLRQVPHVVPSLFSVEELRARRSTTSDAETVEQYAAGPAPLEKLFHESGRTADELSEVSKQLLTSALAAQRESSAIKELSQRFGQNENLTRNGRDALNRLMLSHADALRSALSGQQVLLTRVFPQLTDEMRSKSPDSSLALSLGLEGRHDVELCKELISSSVASPRPARSIASDMITTANATNQALESLIREMGNQE
jgi:hypothetical protein